MARRPLIFRWFCHVGARGGLGRLTAPQTGFRGPVGPIAFLPLGCVPPSPRVELPGAVLRAAPYRHAGIRVWCTAEPHAASLGRAGRVGEGAGGNGSIALHVSKPCTFAAPNIFAAACKTGSAALLRITRFSATSGHHPRLVVERSGRSRLFQLPFNGFGS